MHGSSDKSGSLPAGKKTKGMPFVLALIFIALSSAVYGYEADFTNGAVDATYPLAHRVTLHVRVTTTKVGPAFPFRDGFMWGGDGPERPRCVIDLITIRAGASPVFVPLSAYADLGDPGDLKVLPAPGRFGFALMIRGGDAAGAYEATLTFRDNEIRRRRVTSGEFPQQVWQDTRYSWNHLNN